MTSIRRRLFVILLASTGVIWTCAALWIQHSTRVRVEHVLDRRLEESAQMVASLIARSGGVIISDDAEMADIGSHQLTRQLICQVWGVDDQLKSASQGAPLGRLAGDGEGFSQREVDGEVWRVYTHVDPGQGFRVMVGDALSVRDRLVRGVAMGLLVPMVLILPLLAALIWLAVRSGLAPLDRLAQALSRRPATDLGPLAERVAATELQPVITAINGLLGRVTRLRERERSFTAFAAHELKTPLAGLKAQAQVAAIAPDAAIRDRALAQITRGVDRMDRMVRQLLDMTAVDNAEKAPATPRDGASVLAETAEGLAGLARAQGVSLRLNAASDLWTTMQPALLTLALRNLLENAILASPDGAEVEVELRRHGERVHFSVRDRGPGISARDRPHVTDRFFRGSQRPSDEGSGLGLAIVLSAAQEMAGELRLRPRAGGGEEAELILPARRN